MNVDTFLRWKILVMGVMTGVFGIWMGHEHKGEK